MPGRRVSFDIGSRPTRSGRSQRRDRSAERVHRLVDDFTDMRTHEPTYDQLLRENQILRLNLGDKDMELQRQRLLTEAIRNENEDLQRVLDASSDHEARKASKLKDLRKRNAGLEADNSSLAAQVRDLTRQLKEALEQRVSLAASGAERKKDADGWRRRYEEAHRRCEDLNRRMERMRESMNDIMQENAALKRKLEIEERIRIRHGL